MNKVIVIGASLSGKTTLVKYLRNKTLLSVSEIDDELTQLNNGIFPQDIEYKNKVLFPQILRNILNSSDIIFFTNTWYFSTKDLERVRKRGFKIIQLIVSLETLLERNKSRLRDGYADMEKYLKGMVAYQRKVERKHLVDYVLDGNQQVEKVVDELLLILNEQ